jgi:hypothetical protein
MSISRANRVKHWFSQVKVGDSDCSSKTICSVASPLTKVWRAVIFRPRCGAARNMISLTGIRELLLQIFSIFVALQSYTSITYIPRDMASVKVCSFISCFLTLSIYYPYLFDNQAA